MSIMKLFALTALASSIALLVFQSDRLKGKILQIIAVVASVLEVVILFRIFRFSMGGLNTMLILGATLTIVGGILYTRMSGKLLVASATLLTFVGAIQLLTELNVI